VALVVLVVGFMMTLGLLESVTLHGKTITVPDLKTYSLDEVENKLGELSLNFKVIDSSEYTPKFPRNAVLKQDPPNGSEVKKGRVIYLTVNSSGYSSVKVPNLIGKTNRQAVSYLNAIGFKVGKFEYRPDIGKNVVLEMKHKGKVISDSISLPKQSVIDLVLGSGIGGEKTHLPHLIGLDIETAKSKLVEVSLNLGLVKYDEEDGDETEKQYFIYRQYPEYSENVMLNMGKTVDLWLTSDTLKIPKPEIEEEEVVE
jgi:beta-lactam-binding protein with PASTA domain